MKAARNFAIIALIAFVVAEAPGGGDLAAGILAAMSVTFGGLVGFALYVGYRNNRLSYLALGEPQRRALLVALGGLALMVVGADELLAGGLGALLWISVVGLCAFAIVRVALDARSL